MCSHMWAKNGDAYDPDDRSMWDPECFGDAEIIVAESYLQVGRCARPRGRKPFGKLVKLEGSKAGILYRKSEDIVWYERRHLIPTNARGYSTPEQRAAFAALGARAQAK